LPYKIFFSSPYYSNSESVANHIKALENAFAELLANLASVAIIADGNVKDQLTTAAIYCYKDHSDPHKVKFYATSITSSEAELMAINIGLLHTLVLPDTQNIVVITNSIHTTEKLFASHIHPFQSLTILLANNLTSFFDRDPSNQIHFWACPDKAKWRQHLSMDCNSKDTGCIIPILPSKQSYAYGCKCKCNNIFAFWKMHFSASNKIGRSFLNLEDNKGNTIEPDYKNDRAWLKHFGHNNVLCACITRLITNHAP